MPVQINEVIIRVVVDQQSGGSGTSEPGTDTASSASSYLDEQTLERVLEIIKEKHER